jgi:hypothetical protein
VELRVYERQNLFLEKEKSCILFWTTAKDNLLGNSCLVYRETFTTETQIGMNTHPCILSASETFRLLLPSSHTAEQ